MTERQKNFWRALTAPFPENSYKTRDGHSGRQYTFLKPRAIQNRLDDVVGPGNWDLVYIETSRGMIARLIIEAPDESDTGCKKVSRDGGGGFRAMQDDDSTFKTGFSSSLKLAASAFGIGRELYGDGMPIYCADLHNALASGAPSSGPGAGKPPPHDNGSRNGNGRHDDSGPGNPPFGKPGKAPYAWAKKTGEHFGIDVLGRMVEYARKNRKPERTDQWDEAFLGECLEKTVEWLKKLDNYNGEFGEARSQSRAAQPATPAVNPNGSVISAIVAAVNALLHKKTGRPPKPDEVVAAISEMASAVPNGHGSRGEVMQSLRGCTDAVWLRNIHNLANRQIEEASRQDADQGVDDDIPF